VACHVYVYLAVAVVCGSFSSFVLSPYILSLSTLFHPTILRAPACSGGHLDYSGVALSRAAAPSAFYKAEPSWAVTLGGSGCWIVPPTITLTPLLLWCFFFGLVYLLLSFFIIASLFCKHRPIQPPSVHLTVVAGAT